MFHDFSYINGVLWAVVGIIMIVGNLTYADYYTKMNKKFVESFWWVYSICMGAAILNFLIVLIITLAFGVTKGPSPLNYGLGWLTGLSSIVYTLTILYGIIIGYCNLKQYFGRKRNKI